MICPICNKGELKEERSIRGFIVKKKHIITYCPICGFTKTKIIKMSKEDIDMEREGVSSSREIDLESARNTIVKKKISDSKEVKSSKYDTSHKRIS